MLLLITPVCQLSYDRTTYYNFEKSYVQSHYSLLLAFDVLRAQPFSVLNLSNWCSMLSKFWIAESFNSFLCSLTVELFLRP